MPPDYIRVDHSSLELLPAGTSFKPTCTSNGIPAPNLEWIWKDDGSSISATDTIGRQRLVFALHNKIKGGNEPRQIARMENELSMLTIYYESLLLPFQLIIQDIVKSASSLQ